MTEPKRASDYTLLRLILLSAAVKKPLWILEKYLSGMYFDLYYRQYILQTVFCFQDHPLLLSHPLIMTLDLPNP